jgi:predicted metalloprotease with PDZ domain
MHKGEPQEGDQGLDNTHTWGRTYWGGALFCLIADVEIRRETKNKKGLQDAMRAIMNDKGTIEYTWPINMIFEEGDKATGTHVLEDLYAAWKDKPVTVDLDKLWRELGIEKKGDTVVFHDDAPDAAVRKAITAGR